MRSKLHNGRVTDANVAYVGSIEIDEDQSVDRVREIRIGAEGEKARATGFAQFGVLLVQRRYTRTEHAEVFAQHTHRGFGVEIKDELVKLSNEAARKEGVADRVKFIKADLFKTDISQATVLTMYLLPNTVNLLKDKLLGELRPGTKVLSHDYPLAGWLPEKYVQWDLEDKVQISGVTTTLIYLYVVPAKADGAWSAKLPPNLSREPVRLTLKQQITRVAGSARIGGKDVLLEEAKLRGERFPWVLKDERGLLESERVWWLEVR